MRPDRRTRPFVGRTVMGVTMAVLAVAGCTPDGDADVEIDLGKVREQLEQGADDVRESADEVRDAIAGANLDEETRQAVDEAVTTSREAMEEARAAVAGASDEVGAETRSALDEAADGLADARRLVVEAATETEGAVRAALEDLAAQIDRLTDQIRDA